MSNDLDPSGRKLWFESMVGQVLYRNDNGCNCPVCSKVTIHGLFVENEQHARYLYDTECDYNRDGTPLRYFDTKEEVNEWLNTLQK